MRVARLCVTSRPRAPTASIWRQCLQSGRRYDSIFVVFGHNDRSDDVALMEDFQTLVGEATAGRAKRASVPLGHDADAALKTRLTGVALDKAILTVEFYR